MARLTLEKGLSWSGMLVAAGLVAELALSRSIQPLAFVAFVFVVCPLVVGGMLLFLYTLVSADR